MNTDSLLTVVRVSREHLGAIAELEAQCFSEPWSEASLELLLTDAALGVVALREQTVVGYGGMLLAPGEGQITNLAVSPDARRCGIGARILEALCAEARKCNAEQISLEVRVSNAAAIALYTSHGFAAAGIRKRFYRNPTEDAFVMLCRL